MRKNVNFFPVLSVLITMLLLLLQVESVSAILKHCRGDPIFILSDKTKLVVVVELDTEELNVQEVNYILHVPPGVDVEKVVYTAGGLGEKETYEIVQDNQPDTFTVDTLVTTKVSDVNVIVTTTLVPNVTGTAVGHEGERLVVELKRISPGRSNSP